MKTLNKILLTIIFFATTIKIIAQVPQGIPYQAVARNVSGNLLLNQAISVKFSIRNLTSGGTILYTETHSTMTNGFGLFSVNVGQGTVTLGTFSSIPWGTGAKFLEVQMDPAGGTAYVLMGTQQMMSVPYAFVSGSTLAASTAPIIQVFAGSISNINGSSSTYVFAGSTITVVLTTPKKITGVATGVLGLTSGAPQSFDYNLCYQLGAGTVAAFAGFSYLTSTVTTTKFSYTSSYSVNLGPGSYTIGLGVKNTGPSIMSNNDFVNGWIMITD